MTTTATRTETQTQIETQTEERAAGAHIAALQVMLAEFTDEVNKAIFAELEPFKAEADKAAAVLVAAAALTVDDDVRAAEAAAYMNAIHGRNKSLEAMRTAITKPTLAFKGAIDDLFRTPKANYAQAENELQRKLGAYRARRQAEADAALRDAARQAQSAEEHRQILVDSTTPPPKLEGTRERVKYEIAILDANAIRAARPDLCMPSEPLIRAAVKDAAARGVKINIPGVVITEVPLVGSSGRS